MGACNIALRDIGACNNAPTDTACDDADEPSACALVPSTSVGPSHPICVMTPSPYATSVELKVRNPFLSVGEWWLSDRVRRLVGLQSSVEGSSRTSGRFCVGSIGR